MSHALMWSGGKDCALALWRARAQGIHVTRLLTVHDPVTRRVRFHNTSLAALAAQGTALGIELVPLACAWTEMDQTLRSAFAKLAEEGFTGVVLGDIHLADVRAWYEERVTAAGLEHLEPIWGERPQALLDEFVGIGGRALVTCCELSTLGEDWLGRMVDPDFAREIGATGIDPCGENGEYHSCAVSGPMFEHSLHAVPGARRQEGGFALLDLELSAEPRS